SASLDEVGKIADMISPMTKPYELYNVPSTECREPASQPPFQAVMKMDTPAHWPLGPRPYRPVVA
ncbi:hypothetical protein SK128_000188, partial [Halocaridina rubra]